jgi:voltage-gated potassium channel Kch
MQQRFDKIYLILFAAAAVGLGVWGYAIAGSDYTACTPVAPAVHCIGELHPIRPLTWMELVRCLFAAVGMIRLVDLFQPARDPWQLVIAQVAIPGIALLSAAQLFLTGMRKNLRTAMARRKSGHAIVCGIGDVGMQVIQNLRVAGDEVIAVDLIDDSPAGATCEKNGVPLLRGDAKNHHVLLAAGLRRACTAVLTTGSDSENLDIAMQIKAIQSGRDGPLLRVLVQVRNDWMHKRLMTGGKSALGSSSVELQLFNPFTDAARMLIKRLQLPPAPEFIAETFVIVGFGAYGREMALQLVLSYPVAVSRTLKIVVFDSKADTTGDKFRVTNAAAMDLASFEFLKATIAPGSADIGHVVEPALAAAGPLLGIALALGDDEMSLCAALEMRSLLDRLGQLQTPVYVRLEHYRQLGELVREIESVAAFRDRLQIFGTLEETLGLDVLIDARLDAFAQALHEDYRLRSAKRDKVLPTDAATSNAAPEGQPAAPAITISSHADHDWYALPEFIKMSNRWRADHTPVLMQLAGIRVQDGVANAAVMRLTEEEIELLSQLEHRRYVIERFLTGVRQITQQPNLEDWSKLSEDQRAWNRREVAHVPAIMARLGMQLSRVRTLRLYGETLPSAEAALTQALGASAVTHWNVIADLDDAIAVSLAERALALPSHSLWLLSNSEPREFFLRQTEEAIQSNSRLKLIHAAAGWTSREQLMRRMS